VATIVLSGYVTQEQVGDYSFTVLQTKQINIHE